MIARILLAPLLAAAIAAPAAAQTNPCPSYVAAGYLVCGQDYSANAPAVPIGGYVLVATIPATGRNRLDVQNQSTDTIQVVYDDGAGNNQSSIMLGAAASSGGQGGSITDTSFRGRVRIYAPSSSDQVMAHQE